jgi:Sulfotransferase domain
MWSGPRNVSTAFMRAWENRPDTVVWDEPFYAFYLRKTGIDHPGRDAVLAHHEADWSEVVRIMLSDRPPTTSPDAPPPAIYYQKHMAHHLFDDQGRDWWPGLTHCFLIRRPADMLRSLDARLDSFELRETGLPQQVALFRDMRHRTGRVPPVLDAEDLLRNPRGMLTRLCGALGIPFREEMLSWPPGPRDSDGVWAPHWYDSVCRSTGFHPYRPRMEELPAHLAELEAACLPCYEELRAHRLTPED